MPYNFGPARIGEELVFGCARPRHPTEVGQWLAFLQSQGIRRVCCLLDDEDELLSACQAAFGSDKVLCAPIDDFEYATRECLQGEILPFLFDAAVAGERTVVHCFAGSGRTGHVLAAWLVAARCVPAEDAAWQVMDAPGVDRNPYEAEGAGGPLLVEVLSWAQEYGLRRNPSVPA
jgi:protein-tyrosine phosphatase